MADDRRHPPSEDIMRSLGKIEGTLTGIDDKLDRHHERLNAHGDRIHRVEKRGWFLAGAAAVIGAAGSTALRKFIGG
jgi:hypothetical protein